MPQVPPALRIMKGLRLNQKDDLNDYPNLTTLGGLKIRGLCCGSTYWVFLVSTHFDCLSWPIWASTIPQMWNCIERRHGLMSWLCVDPAMIYSNHRGIWNAKKESMLISSHRNSLRRPKVSFVFWTRSSCLFLIKI